MEETIASGDKQWCSRHNNKQGAWLPTDQFNKGKNSYCKACRNEYRKETYDPEQVRLRNARYYQGVRKGTKTKEERYEEAYQVLKVLGPDKFLSMLSEEDRASLEHYCQEQQECMDKQIEAVLSDNPEIKQCTIIFDKDEVSEVIVTDGHVQNFLPGHKRCVRCNGWKPAREFANRTGKPVCKECKQKPYLTPEQKRDAHLRFTYGITLEQYQGMLEQQDGVCAACGQKPTHVHKSTRELHVDHDHETGEVRGLLCNDCNIALGHLHDNPARIGALLNYIKKFRSC